VADRPGQSDGVRQSLTGGVDTPKKRQTKPIGSEEWRVAGDQWSAASKPVTEGDNAKWSSKKRQTKPIGISHKSLALKELTSHRFGPLYAKQTQFRVAEAATLAGWRCRKPARREAWPTQDQATQDATHPDGTARKLGADEAKSRLQLVFMQRIMSHRFVRPPAIEPIPETKPRFQHPHERPAAFRTNHKESRIRKSARKETALGPERECASSRVSSSGNQENR